MRYFLAACLLGLGLGVALGLVLVTLGDMWTSFEFHEPAALLERVAYGVRTVRSYVTERVDTFTTAHFAENSTPSARLNQDDGRHTSCTAC